MRDRDDARNSDGPAAFGLLRGGRRFGIALVACSLVTAGAAEAACKIQTLEMPVRMIGSRAVATVGINGTQVPLTVDSGAFYSVLTEAAADQLKLVTKRADALRVQGITGRVPTRRTRVDKLEVLGGEVADVEFLVGVTEPGAGTLGLLGRNLLSMTDTEYDLAHGMIRFHFPDGCDRTNMAYWSDTTAVTTVELEGGEPGARPSIRAQVQLNGKDLVALFDTGAQTLVSADAARRVGIADADRVPSGLILGAGVGSSKAYTARFDKFQLGGETISNNTLRIGEFDLGKTDMLLGIDFFLSHRIYVSKAQSKLFITYAGGPVFALNRSATAPAGDRSTDRTSDRETLTADELARRGAASAARGDGAGALADLDRAIALEPASAAHLAQRGALHAAARRGPKALEDLDQALALDPTLADARAARAALRLGAKDRDGARADLDVLDQSLASQAQLRLDLSRMYLALDLPALAIAQLDRWLPNHKTDFTRSGALNNRCMARLQIGRDLDKALDDCNDAVSSQPANPAFLDSRGWVYLRLGKNRDALADFERSVGYAPKDATALYGRGLAKTRQGNAADGEADLAAARKLAPDIDAQLKKSGLVLAPAPS